MNRPNPSINTDAGDKAAGAGYVKRWGFHHIWSAYGR